MNQNVIKGTKNFHLNQRIAWTFLVLALLGFLIYGLSFFFTQPKIETITTDPTNTTTPSNSYTNQTQDVRYQKQTRKRAK